MRSTNSAIAKPLVTLLALLGFAAPTLASGDDCEKRRLEISGKITEAQRCARDSDCALIQFGCPFGCGTPVNSQSTVESITASIEEYNRTCKRCESDCETAKGELRCVERMCTLKPRPTATQAAKRDLDRELAELQTKLRELSKKLKERVAEGSGSRLEKSKKRLREEIESLQTQSEALLKQLKERSSSASKETQDNLAELISKAGEKLTELGERMKADQATPEPPPTKAPTKPRQ
jgi:hypothetical protein